MMYREDYDLPPHRYSRDYYERDRYDERPPPRGSYGALLDDPPYYRDIVTPARTKADRFGAELDTGGYAQGSVYLVPGRPKGPTREKPTRCNTVFVGSLPDGTTEKHLYDAFCEFGPIQDVRVARSRGFGHVEFKNESSIEKAIALNGYTMRIGPGREEASEIQVDYAQSREASDAKRRMKTGEMLVFNAPNAHIISSDLRSEDTFEFAAKNLISWIEKGSCSSTTANTFFGLLSSVNTHCHKLNKEAKAKEEECQAQIAKLKEALGELLKDCDIIDAVFDKASQKKAWDQFTKPQRKTISQWKEGALELRKDVGVKMTEPPECVVSGNEDSECEPPTKKMKADIDTELAAKLSRTVREMEQLKMDHEVAIEKKEKQILQLKTVLARFKQSCPEEWEKVISGKDKENSETPSEVSKSGNNKDGKVKDEAISDEGIEGEGEGEWEVIDGVNMDDLNKALDNGGLAGGGSLAQAAAAYAQLRTQLGSAKEETGENLSENDIALTAVMAAFLTVHPLGATLTEIQNYFMTLNSSYNSYYLESLLRRLPKVFQYAQASAGGEHRWWFLGFQTVSVSQYTQQQQYSGGSTGGRAAGTTEDAQNDTEMSEA